MMRQHLLILLILFNFSVANAQTTIITLPPSDEAITLYFVRHGKTLLNTFDRVQGWSDSPLTEEGKQVARYLGEGLKGIPFDQYYSSDAGRQRETLHIILEQLAITDAHPIELMGLREAFFGGFEGDYNRTMVEAGAKQLGLASSDEMYRKMAAAELPIEQSQNALATADEKGLAENYNDVKQRTQQALQTIITQAINQKAKTILAISSGTAMQIMISDLTDDPIKNRPLPNAAVVKMTYKNGQFTVNEIGNMDYVAQGQQQLAKE